MSEKEFNYDEHPIDRIYVSWANALDSTGEDSSDARRRIGTMAMMRNLKSLMLEVIETGKVADQMKKSIFYGQPFPEHLAQDLNWALEITDPATTASRWDDHEFIRLFHAVIGIAGEAAEMMEALYNYVYVGKDIDMSNIIEETGDSLWYHALIAKWAKFNTLDEFMASNKAKLTQRYGAKWNQEGALNRDTDAEMKALTASLPAGAKVEALPTVDSVYSHPDCVFRYCPSPELCKPKELGTIGTCHNTIADAKKVRDDVDDLGRRG